MRLNLGAISATDTPELGVGQLQEMVEAGDTAGFHEALSALDWPNLTPSELVQLVRLALELGATSTAREIAAEGAQRHAEHEELGRFARVLNPVRAELRPATGQAAVSRNLAWFRDNSSQYRGQWVAVRDGRLLGAALTMEALQASVPDWQDAVVTQVA